MLLEATAFHAANGDLLPFRIGAAARSEATVRDIEAGTSTPGPGAGPFTLVQSIGDSVTLTTFEFDTAVGHHLELDVTLLLAAGVAIPCDAGPSCASTGIAEVIADNTARFFYEPSGDVRLVSESGHDYALGASGPRPVSEPASLLLLCVGGWALWSRLAVARASRRVCALRARERGHLQDAPIQSGAS
jgi:hypothetical protein